MALIINASRSGGPTSWRCGLTNATRSGGSRASGLRSARCRRQPTHRSSSHHAHDPPQPFNSSICRALPACLCMCLPHSSLVSQARTQAACLTICLRSTLQAETNYLTALALLFVVVISEGLLIAASVGVRDCPCHVRM